MNTEVKKLKYQKIPYSNLRHLDDSTKNTLISSFIGILGILKTLSSQLVMQIIKDIPNICKMHHDSCENTKIRISSNNKMHPIKPKRGEIFNAYITTGVGKELKGNHLVIIIQNEKGNIFSEKVNVIPIEGDGNIINPIYNIKLTNSELEEGNLDKIPSRAITSDILTLDKARLGRKIGKINDETMCIISKNLRRQLDI